jgi:hypothetical protein
VGVIHPYSKWWISAMMLPRRFSRRFHYLFSGPDVKDLSHSRADTQVTFAWLTI